MKIGAQLYTLREHTKDLTSFAETLKKVADIGYTVVQVSGTCAFEAEWLRDQLKKNGLICAVTHTNPDRIAGEIETVAAEHLKFDCRHVGIGCAPGGFEGGLADYIAFRDRFLPVASRLKECGVTLNYHNHEVEFQKFNGKTIIEQMAEDFPLDELSFVLDTYWIQYAGASPASWIKRLSGRVPCVHLKDFAIVGHEQRMAAIGEGNIDFNAVISACEQAGTRYLLVEQDDCYGEDPFDCLKRSYVYLKATGLS